MTDQEFKCARPDCPNVITEKTSWNQKYCCHECTRLATNARIMVKYYDKKDQLSGKKRICEICDETVLSRYNDTKICSLCQKREEARRNEEIASMMKSLGLDGD